MLDFFGPKRICRGTMSRRDVLCVGGLAIGGLTLADVLRSQAGAASGAARGKSVIMIWMRGGPSHIDSFDMKPEAPAEVRGEFNPISTNVPGIQICEYMPLLAGDMDKLAIVRGIKSNDLGDHTPHYIITGSPDRGKRPAFGAIVSYLQQSQNGLPPYVSLNYETPGLYDYEAPLYLGASHRPFAPRSEGLDNLSLARGVTRERLSDRKRLIREFDSLNRAYETIESMSGIDSFTQQALEIVASPHARDAFDVSQESPETYERYGKFCENFLIARRLVEAGVSVVTLKVGDWDTHEKNFIDMRTQLPQLDRGFHALVSDLHERGLDKDVAVVLWGEFGRAPRISRGDGRDHWPEAGAAVLAGGGFRAGQTIGQTDSHGGQALGRPYTPGNVQSNLYRHLGIDPSITIPDHNQRPMHLLDDRALVEELVG
ncbi:MAG TPA: DUF1501 domain-containing protein [Planctomycetaceae bacterium]|nr:DUF1501 domain-containing protein [Planctomycetaceae bacterium]